jgi:hypothetical protein
MDGTESEENYGVNIDRRTDIEYIDRQQGDVIRFLLLFFKIRGSSLKLVKFKMRI